MTAPREEGPRDEGPRDEDPRDEAALAAQVEEGLAGVRRRIESAGGDPNAVTIVAVTKTFGEKAVRAALEAGLCDLGENYANELLDKASKVTAGPGGAVPHWHYLGSIQRNKIARLAPVVSCWQAVSREVEAEAIAARSAADRIAPPGVFVEVNVAGEPTRAGCAPDKVARLVQSARDCGLTVRGLMAVAPADGGGADGGGIAAGQAFSLVARLRAEIGLSELSIGMSGDLEQAVQAGSTMIRVGTALFGARKSRAAGLGL